MKSDSVEITTICPDVENSQFVVQSNCPETIPEILKSQNAAVNGSGIACQQRSLPRIKILGTGGTIASKAIDSSQTAGYHVDLTIQDLLMPFQIYPRSVTLNMSNYATWILKT